MLAIIRNLVIIYCVVQVYFSVTGFFKDLHNTIHSAINEPFKESLISSNDIRTEISKLTIKEHPHYNNCSLLFKLEGEFGKIDNTSKFILMKDSKQKNYTRIDKELTIQGGVFYIYNTTWDGCNCQTYVATLRCKIVKIDACFNGIPVYTDQDIIDNPTLNRDFELAWQFKWQFRVEFKDEFKEVHYNYNKTTFEDSFEKSKSSLENKLCKVM